MYNEYIEALFELALSSINEYVTQARIINRDYMDKVVKIDYLKLNKELPRTLLVKQATVVLYTTPAGIDGPAYYHESLIFAPSLVNRTHILTNIEYRIKRDSRIIYVFIV